MTSHPHPDDYTSLRIRTGPDDRRESSCGVDEERRTGLLRRVADRLRMRMQALRAYWRSR